jgi:predicted restriction endonuclease
MAQECAICGASINLVQQQKLADGNFILPQDLQEKGNGQVF